MAEYTPAQFARALERAVGKTPKETVAVVRKGANNVKPDARRNVSQTAPVHNARAQQFINYDVEAQGVEVVAEVGYDRDAGKRWQAHRPRRGQHPGVRRRRTKAHRTTTCQRPGDRGAPLHRRARRPR
jgi:hypothetical protein